MKIITLILFFASTLLSQDVNVKTLQYLVNNKINKLPVLRMGSNDHLKIYFEIEANSQPAFDILFYFCNDDWEIYDNLLLEDIGTNRLYNVYVDRLPITTEGAEYFVNEKFPNDRIKFQHSGKWMFFIVDPYDDEMIYEWGKFFVVDNSIELNTKISNWRREGRISNNNANDRVLNLRTRFNLPDSLTPFNLKHIEIIKNMELEYSTRITKDSFQKNRAYEWNGGNSHEFVIRDLEPGNEYRQTDLRNINKYQFPDTRAQFDGLEYSRFYVKGKKDLNGGFKLKDRSNQYSDYLTVKFQFRPPENTFMEIVLKIEMISGMQI